MGVLEENGRAKNSRAAVLDVCMHEHSWAVSMLCMQCCVLHYTPRYSLAYLPTTMRPNQQLDRVIDRGTSGNGVSGIARSFL